MPSNMYDEMPEGPQPAPAQAPGEDAAPKRENSRSSTALVPKEFFEGGELKIGQRCEVEVASIHEDEVSIRYVESDHDDEQPEADPEAGAPPPLPQGGPQGPPSPYD